MSGEGKDQSPEDVFEKVVSKNDACRWVLLELSDDSKSIVVASTGEDFPSFKESFDPAKVLWARINARCR